MQVEKLAIPKKQAEKEYQALKLAFRQHKKLRQEQVRQDLAKVYGHLRHGKKLIDIYTSFKNAGLNDQGYPKLAIVRADSKIVVCTGGSDGSCIFYHDRGQGNADGYFGWRGNRYDVTLPPETFSWNKKENGYTDYPSRIQTIVPIIPAEILVTEVKALLKNFHILWEVDEWKPVAPRDPILLRRLTPNLFGVLATWNLTELERAVIRGRIPTDR